MPCKAMAHSTKYKVFTLQAKEDTLDHLVTYAVLKFLMDNINIYITV